MRTERFSKNTAGNLIHDNFPFGSMSDVREAQLCAGFHWFGRDALSFFKSQLATDTYSGGFFVSSEKRDDEPRMYTVRRAMPNGAVETIGDFQAHSTKRAAIVALREAQEKVYLGRESIDVTRRGRKWEVAARGWDFGDGYGVIVVVECLERFDRFGENWPPVMRKSVDERPSKAQERDAVARLVSDCVRTREGTFPELRYAPFRRIRAVEHKGWWVPSLYQVGTI